MGHTPPGHVTGRRRFLTRLTAGTLGAGALVMLAAVLRLPFPRIRNQSDIVRVGRVSEYPLYRYTFVPGHGVFVFRDRAGIRVLSAVCTHLGCIVRSSESGFHCPCHGSQFDRSGQALSGPASRPLDWLYVEREPNGTLVVDLTRRVSPDTVLMV